MVGKDEFMAALAERNKVIMSVLNDARYGKIQPEALKDAIYSYLNRGGKRYRPGILFFCCGAVGGREEQAKFAASAVEVYHTWTLVHDDIIDNDQKRRGLPTVHEEFRVKAMEWGYRENEAVDFGRSVAILTGDVQHAWSVRLLIDSLEEGVPATVVLDLIRRLEHEVTYGLVEGEALDVLFSRMPVNELSETDVIRMLELKTGVLYEFAGQAGAAIGLGQTPAQNSLVAKVGGFARSCGTAFQLQDDILGITGDEKMLGKPVGSDIREGKRTTIVLYAYEHADARDRCYLEEWLGNPAAGTEEITRVKEILLKNGGIDHTRRMADEIVRNAVTNINDLPDSKYKDLLLAWARYVVDREF